MTFNTVLNSLRKISAEKALELFSPQADTVAKISHALQENPPCLSLIDLGLQLHEAYKLIVVSESLSTPERRQSACEQIASLLLTVLYQACRIDINHAEETIKNSIHEFSTELNIRIQEVMGVEEVRVIAQTFLRRIGQQCQVTPALHSYYPLSPRADYSFEIEGRKRFLEILKDGVVSRNSRWLAECCLQTTYHCLIEWDPSFRPLNKTVEGNSILETYLLMSAFLNEQSSRDTPYKKLVTELFLRHLRGGFLLDCWEDSKGDLRQMNESLFQRFLAVSSHGVKELSKGDGLVFSGGGTAWIFRDNGHAILFEVESLRVEGERKYILRIFNTGAGRQWVRRFPFLKPPKNCTVFYFPLSETQIHSEELWKIIGNIKEIVHTSNIYQSLSQFSEMVIDPFESGNVQQTSSCTIMCWWAWIEYHFVKSFGVDPGKRLYLTFRKEFESFLSRTLRENSHNLEDSALKTHILGYLDTR